MSKATGRARAYYSWDSDIDIDKLMELMKVEIL